MTVQSDIKNAITFGVSHLVLLGLLLISVACGIYEFDSRRADRADAKTQVAESTLANATAQSGRDEAAFHQVLNALTVQNAALTQAISQRESQLAAQKQIDSTASIDDTAKRLGGSVIDARNIDLPLDTARGLVSSLDILAATSADLVDETKTAANLQAELDSEATVVIDLRTQLDDSAKACAAQVASVKAKARKSKFKWFLGGAATAGAIALRFL